MLFGRRKGTLPDPSASLIVLKCKQGDLSYSPRMPLNLVFNFDRLSRAGVRPTIPIPSTYYCPSLEFFTHSDGLAFGKTTVITRPKSATQSPQLPTQDKPQNMDNMEYVQVIFTMITPYSCFDSLIISVKNHVISRWICNR